ncbi:MAG: C40 family peptidase [Micrococcus sp.]|nr:C40 family peptidase [Micrococcus sp.]
MSIEAVETRIAQIQSTIVTLSARPAWAGSPAAATGLTTAASAGSWTDSGSLAGGVLGSTGDFSAVLDEALAQGSAAAPSTPGSGAFGSGTSGSGTSGSGTPGAGASTGVGTSTGAGGTTGAGAVSGTGAAGSGGGSDFGDRIVQSARKHLGVRYVWGGNSPSQGFDCSGLVKYVMKELGVSMPRVARDQAKMGTEVASLAQARPGDLLGMRNGSHIAIYLGDNKILHAPRPGENVSIRPLYSWDDIDTIRRVVPSGSSGSHATGVSVSPASASTGVSTRAAFEQLAGVGA